MSDPTFTRGFIPSPDVIRNAHGPIVANVFGVVWMYCQMKGRECYAELGTVAANSGFGTTAVRAALSLLASEGWIVATKRDGRTTVYHDAGRWTMTVIGEEVRQWDTGTPTPRVAHKREPQRHALPTPTPDVGLPQRHALTNILEEQTTQQTKSHRAPKPLFDAFKGAFPKASNKMAGQFDSECSKVGLSIEDWHAFMASTKAKQDYLDGFLTMGNALNRFNAWAVAVGRRSNPASRDDTPDGAPANWRDIVYTHDGTRRYPALALPRLGLEPYAPPSEWPTWYQQFEGVQS